MILTVDIGNTATKLSIFEGERLVHSISGKGLGAEAVESMLCYNTLRGAAYCCVGEDSYGIEAYLRQTGLPLVKLEADTPVPMEVTGYSRPQLGADRLAAAVGAFEPGCSALVVDAGTALTADLICRGALRGGNISPGLTLRFKSLHEFTSRLPLVDAKGSVPAFGHDTATAIRSGVVLGIVAEIKASYQYAVRDVNYAGDGYKDKDITQLILTGGDADLLEPWLVQEGLPVKVDHEAVGRGLVRIFNYNNRL